jgi:cytoskeletal protein RodZ
VEENPKKSEEDEDTSSDNGRENMKVWFQENLRMIVSIVIVVVIALGIYSYSKRNQVSTNPSETSISDQSEGKINVVGGDNTAAQNEETQESQPSEKQDQAPSQPATNEQKPSTTPSTQVTGASNETDTSFIETAARGDGSTKLARRALANYLEKNPNTSLTAEHKVFIEDMLRRQVKDGRLKAGDTREFSKDSIAKAIEKSKTLNERQLKNLHKFSQRVPELSK